MTQQAVVNGDYPWPEQFGKPSISIRTTDTPVGYVALLWMESVLGSVHFSSEKARELAVRILDAADTAEQQAAGNAVSTRQLELHFTPID